MNEKILLTEDDAFLRDGLCEMLSGEGYSVSSAASCGEARALLSKEKFDLLICDVMLPDGSGFDLCTSVRNTGSSVPILFLTACDDELQIVRGLDSGADDYVTKPFKLHELLSRIRALLRRSSNQVYTSRDITVDLNALTVKKNGEVIFVTPTELQILLTLIRNSSGIVTRGSLLQNIWDSGGAFIDDNTLSVHISRLREKIGAEHIVTVRGVGYRWE